ncbi:peptidyl-prolyl cis-trans isomerase [Acrocarpospora phusangensis]|uniref:Peptidyl-prolyl cis-trans isomerase n=1 Tax=Acrocarpospora phusangensis TaxID=1070424 RepID=A0A919Q8Q6_9ACTN|nr:peptidylprolyl isomerase [Acrocarpospora phusangensis]GIH22933.1 peptidyl-prolyl cis-trans isomerase [Acrocarpospora phusangensis]
MVSGKDRQKQLAREHYERQQAARIQRERAAKRTAAIGTTVGVLVVIGGIVAAATLLGGGGEDPTTASPTDTAVPSASAPPAGPKAYDPASGSCEYLADGQAAKDVGQPPAKVSAQPATMTINTSLGTIEATLDGAKAPCTVGSFEFLASKKYFDGTKCHRLTTEGIKVLQCGDPTASGSGGPGYRFADENLEGASYKRGVLAMANSGPGTNGSQFFIVYGDETDSLPDSYTPFGTITKGLDVVDKVAKDGVEGGGGDGPPKTAVEIKDVTITGKS